MRFGVAFFLPFSLVCFAQDPPPEVDQALRARVNEFFTYHTKGEFRKAMPLVAQETQDEYFASQKTKYESYRIDSITYSDNFTKAVVKLTVQEKKRISPRVPEILFTEPTSTLWKIEDGKWCWYNDHRANWVLPMGPSDPKAIDDAHKGVQNGPPPLSPEKMAEMAGAILGQSSLNKTDVTLSADKPSSDEVIFKNGQSGTVKIALETGKLPPGMTANLDKTEVPMNGQAVLKINYTPQQGATPGPVTLNIIMEPFSKAFPVNVQFASAK